MKIPLLVNLSSFLCLNLHERTGIEDITGWIAKC